MISDRGYNDFLNLCQDNHIDPRQFEQPVHLESMEIVLDHFVEVMECGSPDDDETQQKKKTTEDQRVTPE